MITTCVDVRIGGVRKCIYDFIALNSYLTCMFICCNSTGVHTVQYAQKTRQRISWRLLICSFTFSHACPMLLAKFGSSGFVSCIHSRKRNMFHPVTVNFDV